VGDLKSYSIAFFFSSLFLIAEKLPAHPLDVGYLAVQQKEDHLEVSLELNPKMAETLLGNANAGKDKNQNEALLQSTLFGTKVKSPAGICQWNNGSVSLKSNELLTLSAQIRCSESDPETLELSPSFLQKLPTTFQLFVRSDLGGSTPSLFVADKDSPIHLSPRRSRGLMTFIYMGMQHIGITPDQWMHGGRIGLPDGIDHILFIVALILACFHFRNIVFAATGFTIGHSLTLALGAYDVVHLPQKLVESAIAMSIAWMGIEALLRRQRKRLWIETSLFGLVHGLGLASALQELNLHGLTKVKALFGFNVGVEIGQLGVVAVIFPTLLLISRWPKFSLAVVRTAASLVSICGLFWMVSRLAA